MDFESIVAAWKHAAEIAVDAEAKYRANHAAAFITADAKTEAARKAAADVATVKERRARDLAELEAQAAKYRVEQALRRTGPEAA